MEVLAPLAMLLAALVTAIATYFINKRKSSGKISTSEAADLWAESRAIREEYKNDRNALKDEVAALRKEVRDCHSESKEYKARIEALERGANGRG